ncbi:hypothetical protein GALMADRAFT_225654 [Galerina marginata CBS 339.88]|uniref:Uncharacterized protein n=1 Tax=Galerina marginata (strain CBS 339.88) TaxID=685588 RepID=A0A067T0N6_GALM3|nr:hypothetical protein GALMADRAFT_225654 [Galerina marginata CBS 339.88]
MTRLSPPKPWGLSTLSLGDVVNVDDEDGNEHLTPLSKPRVNERASISPRGPRPLVTSMTPSRRYEILSPISSVNNNTCGDREKEEDERPDAPLLRIPQLLSPLQVDLRPALRQAADAVDEKAVDLGPVTVPLDDAHSYYQLSDVAHCAFPPSPSFSGKFLDSPPVTGASYAFPSFPTPPKSRHPFAEGYEVPQWKLLIIHIVLCALTYPFLLVFVIASAEKSLFWARFLVGAGCGLVGLALGMSLLNLARAILEAAAWATIVHQSRLPNSPGVRLKDLASHAYNPSGARGALKLLWDRRSYQGTQREVRKLYDDRRWSLWIVFFLLNISLSGVLSFLLGRVMDINIRVIHQYQDYHEVAVAADISDQDIQQADILQSAFDNYALTWTLAPFSTHGSLPPAVSFAWKNDSVFFSEVILSQLVPGGSGFGTFQPDTTSPTLDLNAENLSGTDPSVGAAPGAVLRFPRWGIRIKCTKIPDISDNLIPISYGGLTYLFTPRETIRHLFQYFDMTLPQNYEQPFNFSSFINPNDTFPSGFDASGIAAAAAFSNNGVAHSLKSSPSSLGENGDGFITLEHVLVRLNDTYAQNGTFGVKGTTLPDINGTLTYIGYDAAVCLELYEPWVVEVYNSSVSIPGSMRIVDKAASIKDMNTQITKEQLKGSRISNPLVKRVLNSTNLTSVYIVGHQNSVNQILKDNGRDSNYVPSPTLISFTGGQGPLGYTKLSEVYFAKARALADASNVLPYFAGSGLSVARRYPDQIVTNTKIANTEIATMIFVVCLMGGISALFVPRLPHDLPRRGFDLYSWFSAFSVQELVVDHPGRLGKHMELREVVDYAGEQKFYYATNCD